MLEMFFTCLACDKVFKVPHYRGEENMPPEMIVVIEHEDDHIANNVTPGWDLDIKEAPSEQA
jgi:hypothetical protein